MEVFMAKSESIMKPLFHNTSSRRDEWQCLLLSFRRDLLSFSSTTRNIITFLEELAWVFSSPLPAMARDYAVAPQIIESYNR